MGKVKVLHVFPARSWGGAEIQMIEIAQWTRELGIEPSIWCVKGSPIERQALRVGLSTVTDPLPLRAAIPPLWKIIPVLRRERPDIIHLHWAAGMRLFYGVKWFLPVNIVFYNHMWVTLKKRDLVHKLAYADVDAMTVSGPRAYRAVAENLAVTAEQLVECPYGIDLRNVRPELLEKKSAEERAKWGLPADATVFGFFGRIDRQKGTKEFVQTADDLLGRYRHLHYLLVGDPTLGEEDALRYKDEVFGIIDRSPYKDRIHYFGHQSDFHAPMSCCDLIVMPSYNECYSILILHAFALGLPVVSTNAGGTPDLLNAPERGWLVEPRNADSLRETLLQIAANPTQILERAGACKKYVLAHHTHEIVGQRFVKIYESVLKGRPLDF